MAARATRHRGLTSGTVSTRVSRRGDDDTLLVFALAESVAFFEEMGAHGGRMADAVRERSIEVLWRGVAP